MESFATVLQNQYGISGDPQYLSKFCMNAGTFGDSCSKCVELCPEHIFEDKKVKRPKFDACTKCGICMAACPSRAISPVSSRVREFMMAVARDDEISVGCGRDQEGWSVELECVAALSWEQIAIAAMRNGITISMRECGSCDREACRTQIVETIEKARRFLGDDLFFDKVQILEKGDDYELHGAGISRRELLTFFKRLPLDTAINMLPEFKNGEQNGFIYRGVLRDLVNGKYEATPKEQRPRYIVDLPALNDNCYMCGLCKRMCPEKALEIKQSPDGATFTVAVDAWKCTGCGACVKMCHEKAIDGLKPMSIPHLGRVLLKRIKRYTCSMCGSTIKPSSPDGLCDSCRIKEKVRKQKEEKERLEREKKEQEEKERMQQQEEKGEEA